MLKQHFFVYVTFERGSKAVRNYTLEIKQTVTQFSSLRASADTPYLVWRDS